MDLIGGGGGGGRNQPRVQRLSRHFATSWRKKTLTAAMCASARTRRPLAVALTASPGVIIAGVVVIVAIVFGARSCAPLAACALSSHTPRAARSWPLSDAESPVIWCVLLREVQAARGRDSARADGAPQAAPRDGGCCWHAHACWNAIFAVRRSLVVIVVIIVMDHHTMARMARYGEPPLASPARE